MRAETVERDSDMAAVSKSRQDIRIIALFGARVMFGQERANIETLVCLRERGCAVLCLLRDDDAPELDEIQRFMESFGLECARVPYIDYPIRGYVGAMVRRMPAAFVRGNRALRKIIMDYRATHIHASNAFFVISFGWALRHSTLPMIYRAGDKPTVHNFFRRWCWSFVCRRTSVFVADSKFIAKCLTESGIPSSSVTIAYAPAPRRSSASSTPLQLPGPSSKSGAVRILFAGQISAGKGVDILVDAFRMTVAHHPCAHLLIAGSITDWSGHDWGRELRRRTMADSALNTRVHFLGYVEDVPNLMKQCHFSVNSSLLEEAYGLVIVEAKQAGIPTIIFSRGGMRELVESGRTGLVVEDFTAEGLAAAMSIYLNSPELVRKHGTAAAASIAELGIGEYGDRWLQIYQHTSENV